MENSIGDDRVYCHRMMERLALSEVNVYTMPPIDWFEGTIPAEDWIASAPEPEPNVMDGNLTRSARLDRVIAAAYFAAKVTRWEGDASIYVAALPCERATEPVFILKQNHSGTTYVVSPHLLPHLESVAYEHVLIHGPKRK